MSKITGTLLKVALALFIAGAICTVGAFALSGFNIENLSTEDANRVDEVITESVSVIKVNDKNVPVRITYGYDDKLSVSYCETNRHEYEIIKTKLADGTYELNIVGKNKEDKSPASWLKNIGVFEMTNKTLRIYLPEDNADIKLIDIETTNGSVNMDEMTVSGAVKIKTSNASANVYGSTLSTLDIATTNGSVSVYDVTASGAVTVSTTNASCTGRDVLANSISFSSTSGSITLSDSTVAEDITLTSKNASISVNYTMADTLSLSTTHGRVELYEVTSAKNITAETSNSWITVDDITSPNITLKTTNGGVSGEITGSREDYTISAKTTNGSSNLKDAVSENGGKLIVETTNARIDIQFSDDDYDYDDYAYETNVTGVEAVAEAKLADVEEQLANAEAQIEKALEEAANAFKSAIGE